MHEILDKLDTEIRENHKDRRVRLLEFYFVIKLKLENKEVFNRINSSK